MTDKEKYSLLAEMLKRQHGSIDNIRLDVFNVGPFDYVFKNGMKKWRKINGEARQNGAEI